MKGGDDMSDQMVEKTVEKIDLGFPLEVDLDDDSLFTE